MITKLGVLSLAGCLFLSGLVACQKEGANDPNVPVTPDPIGNQPTGDGTAWLTGDVNPGPDLGKEADFYIQSTSGDLYRRVQGVWKIILGMKGATGLTGAAGPQGPAGISGAQGAPGAHGAVGPAGAKGDKGDKGLTGDRGAAGIAGAKGDKGEKGDKGDKGERGENGLDALSANIIPLLAEHQGKDAVYTVVRDLKVTIPKTLQVLYGTGAMGISYLSIGRKIICSYRGGSVNSKDPPPGNEDYELGKLYRLVQCATQKSGEYVLDSAEASTASDTFGMAPGDEIRLSVATAGGRIPGAKVIGILTVAY